MIAAEAQSKSELNSNWISERGPCTASCEKMTSTPVKKTTTVKADEKKKKTVFKQLLDSPFNLTWHNAFKRQI